MRALNALWLGLVLVCGVNGAAYAQITTVPKQETLPKEAGKQATQTETKETPAADKWEKELAAIEAKTGKLKPEKRRWIFTGSSSIRLWKLADAFPEMPYVNHGFGGSQMHDVTQHFDRLIGRWKPEGVVLYSGDNDLGAKKTPEQIVGELNKIMDRLTAELPNAKLVVIGTKASVKRWALNEQRLKTVALMKETIEVRKNPRYSFVDYSGEFLDSAENPRPELYQADGLHLSPAGYKIWNDRLTPLLK